MASRDQYRGWVWLGSDTPESVKFGYAYQDPAAGLTVRTIVDGAWKRPIEELVAEARSTGFMGTQTTLVRLGGAAFESLGQKHFPEEMRAYAPEAMKGSVQMMESDIESGHSSGYMIVFVPDVLYAGYGLPEAPGWMGAYTSQGSSPVTSTTSVQPEDDLDLFAQTRIVAAKRVQIVGAMIAALSVLLILIKPTDREMALLALGGILMGGMIIVFAGMRIKKLSR